MYRKFLILIPIILLSGCVNFSGILAQLGVGEPKYVKTEGLSVSAEAIPEPVYGGEGSNFYFELENTGNTTLNNVGLEITDPCVFHPGKLSKFIGRMEPSQREEWKWRLTADKVKAERECDVRYRVSYFSQAFAVYDLAAISEQEYIRLRRQNRLEKEIPLSYYKTKSPLDIKVDISREQPLLEGSEFYLNLQIVNVGGGKIERLEIPPGNLVIDYPNFLIPLGCDDFYPSRGRMVLGKSLKFFDKKTKKSACKFRVGKRIGIKQMEQFKINLKYKYIDNKIINIKVKP